MKNHKLRAVTLLIIFLVFGMGNSFTIDQAAAESPNKSATVTIDSVHTAGLTIPGIHAIKAHNADNKIIWFYDRKDRKLASFKKDDVVEIKFKVVPSKHGPGGTPRDENFIIEIKKIK